jgi:hypothetical protein
MGGAPSCCKKLFTVPLSDKVYITVISNSHSKIYISESVYFFCETLHILKHLEFLHYILVPLFSVVWHFISSFLLNVCSVI